MTDRRKTFQLSQGVAAMKTKLIPALLLVVFAAASSVASAQNQEGWNDAANSPFPYTVGSPNIE
jgi:hypothetical protein